MRPLINITRPSLLFFCPGFLPVGLLWGLLATLLFLTACSPDASGKPAVQDPGRRPAVPVTVATVTQKTVPVQLRAIGNVQTYATVAIKAQVNGELQRVHFKEGQDVRAGDLLFTIDPRPFEVQLKQAEANLAKDTIQLENARRELRRYDKLLKEGYVTQEQYDQRRTTADALEATVRVDQTAIDNAKLQLSYCFIRSPIDGRTGNLLVHKGNLVKANDTTPLGPGPSGSSSVSVPLVVINQMSPIYVAFSVPEQHLPEIRKHMGAEKLHVDAIISPDGEWPAQGELSFIDNAVDFTTGTIQLKATFPNHDRTPWPGQFVNVVLTLATQPNAIVVPSQAVQTGQAGQFVFVVQPDLAVEPRLVVVDREVGAETVVKEGLKPGESVVTDGQLRLSSGAKVEVHTSPTTAATVESAQ
ncbi:MAG: efflux RND transporter periplasmic adaptor subunit [Deltaproteobacteria bacterium]|nr:efflux RND transporter periplasmic adaptor subunit [Deltaproteobacteria bacterium]